MARRRPLYLMTLCAAALLVSLPSCSTGDTPDNDNGSSLSGGGGGTPATVSASASATATATATVTGGTTMADTDGVETDGVCGDGVVSGSELCDGLDLDGMTCADFGYSGGALACTGTCTFDTAGCNQDGTGTCGNGQIDGTEQCDGADLGGTTCLDLGFTGGTLACSAGCSFDTAACTQNGGAGQPDSGLYAHCIESDVSACTAPWTGCLHLDTNGFCTGQCVNATECDLGLGGTAMPVCLYSEAAGYNLCALDCSSGKTCPDLMVCTTLSGALAGDFCV